MFFGVFDMTFVVWIAIGAIGVLVVLGAKAWFEDLAIPMNWWKWLILSAWYLWAMMMLAAPFTFMGEGEVSAGWRSLIFVVPAILISGVIVYRVLAIGRAQTE